MTAPLCPYCGEPGVLDLFEIWGHDFQLETCCEGSYEDVCLSMAEDPEWAASLLRRLGAEHYTGRTLRRLVTTWDGCPKLAFDFDLDIRPVGRVEANRFVRAHHEHNGPLPIDRFRAAIFNGPTLLGVCIVGNPTPPAYMNRGWVEVRRLCLDRSVPDELRWKACSAFYAWAAREAERRGWRKITTYTLESESGMSLRYARWKREGAASREGHSWAARRPGRAAGPTEPKVLWSKTLRPVHARPIQRTFEWPRQARRPVTRVQAAAA